jgi:histone demethylase JARID1
MAPRSADAIAGTSIPDHASNPDSDPGNRANMNYIDGLAMFHKQHGTNYSRLPSVDKRPLDLYKLKKAVEIRGGFEQVCKTKKWAEIGRDLGYSGKIMSSLSTSLKNSYQRYLQPYEEYLARAKPGVQQQLELEHGGPFTPSPRPSPLAKKPILEEIGTPSKILDETLAMRMPLASGAPIEKSSEPTPSVEPTPPPRPTPSGFTPVNAGATGFTAVNHSPSFATVNNNPTIKHEGENGTSTPQSIAEQHCSTPVANGDSANPAKRAISHDSASQAESGDADGGSGRRSKRLKKGMSDFCDCTAYLYLTSLFLRFIAHRCGLAHVPPSPRPAQGPERWNPENWREMRIVWERR